MMVRRSQHPSHRSLTYCSSSWRVKKKRGLLVKISDGGVAVFQDPNFIGNVLCTHTASSIQNSEPRRASYACLNVTSRPVICCILARKIHRINIRTNHWVVEVNVIAVWIGRIGVVLVETDLSKFSRKKN